MPMMSSMVALFTNMENISRAISTKAAPSMAPSRMLTDPPSVVPNTVPMLPPNASITMATPRPEPVETPRIDGSARGLAKTVCNSSPLTASAAPASAAVVIMGSRVSVTITCQA